MIGDPGGRSEERNLLDDDTLRLLETALKRDTEPLLLIDAGPLKRFDSSALAVLLECRRLALSWGDQPYGAVLVQGGRIIGNGPSRVVKNRNPDAHAEREAIERRRTESAAARKALETQIQGEAAELATIMWEAATDVVDLVRFPAADFAKAPVSTTVAEGRAAGSRLFSSRNPSEGETPPPPPPEAPSSGSSVVSRAEARRGGGLAGAARDSAAAATAGGDGSGPGLSATPTRRDDEPEE